MICVVIKGPSVKKAFSQIAQAIPYADLIELRIDLFEEIELNGLKELCKESKIPMIFTLRSALQGGKYVDTETQHLNDLRNLATLKPCYLDLESHVPPAFVAEIAASHPEIKLILSHHDFTGTPSNLDELYEDMKKISVWGYKIAVTAGCSLDGLRFLSWAKNAKGNLIAISMGPHGQISRILAPVIGSPITYASLEDEQQTAPGQLSAKVLIHRYRYRTLTPQTALYGLIGDPVEQSISDQTHNAVFQHIGIDTVYIKIQVKGEDLKAWLELAKKLSFKGFSVTMPLKEVVLPYLDEVIPQARAIGAVNTLFLKDEKWIGSNTDSIGALNAIEKKISVKGKRLVILGAGGAAKAIAYEGARRGAFITIINRDVTRAQQIGKSVNGKAKGLDKMSECRDEGYDILINCTPAAMPIESEDILPNAIVMDIKTKPKETVFLQCAKTRGCEVIYGYEMFVEQALGQFDLWFKEKCSMEQCRDILEKNVLEIL
ncbi:MAG: shikimate dehydrogenase [Parachlamydiaceae bacterium]|nr:shikimate dehydrogenase [Parachlamydiaceae bacterium]